MRSEAKLTNATASYLKETTAFVHTPIRVQANTKNVPDEATNFPERKVNVKRETADN